MGSRFVHFPANNVTSLFLMAHGSLNVKNCYELNCLFLPKSRCHTSCACRYDIKRKFRVCRCEQIKMILLWHRYGFLWVCGKKTQRHLKNEFSLFQLQGGLSLRTEPLSLHPGLLLLFSSLHLSKLIAISSKHLDKSPKGTMPSANSWLRRYQAMRLWRERLLECTHEARNTKND